MNRNGAKWVYPYIGVFAHLYPLGAKGRHVAQGFPHCVKGYTPNMYVPHARVQCVCSVVQYRCFKKCGTLDLGGRGVGGVGGGGVKWYLLEIPKMGYPLNH